MFLSSRPDSNWRPLPWQGSALPTEPLLLVALARVAGPGLEPGTSGLWALRAAIALSRAMDCVPSLAENCY